MRTTAILSTEELESLRRLGARVRLARLSRNLTQAEFAGRMGVRRLTVVNLEKGRAGVSLDTTLKALTAGRQWIATFPTAMDTFDDPRVEAVCLDAAEAAGFAVPERKLVAAGGRAALFVERFDRERGIAGRPFAYLSAATLLRQPSARYGTERTYADIAAAARTIGARDAAATIFGRPLLNARLHNTDDHLRNHAFIDRRARWELSPVFDLLPHPDKARHRAGLGRRSRVPGACGLQDRIGRGAGYPRPHRRRGAAASRLHGSARGGAVGPRIAAGRVCEGDRVHDLIGAPPPPPKR